MMTCDQSRELFVDVLYGELPSVMKSGFDNHVASCERCSAEIQEMKMTLTVMDQRRRTEPDQVYWNGYWEQLSSRILDQRTDSINEIQAPRKFTFRPARLPAWAYGIAAMMLVVIGVYLGRTYFGEHELGQVRHGNPVAISSSGTIEDSTTIQALTYLSRSKNLLIGLANLDEEQHTSLDLSREQAASRRLIQQATALKVALNRPDQQLMRQLIMDLEVILLQLANIEVRPGVPAVQLVQKGIDQKSILLKINLEEMRGAARRQTASREKKSNL